MNKILVPLDGSKLAEAVVPYIRQIASGLDASVTLLHVEAPKGAPRVEMEEGYLEWTTTTLRQQGVEVAMEVASGLPHEEIVRYAKENGFSLIAMATHGRSGLGRWAYGSVADKVLHSTSIPVFLIRPSESGQAAIPQEPIKGLLVPLDGSELAEEALPFAEALAVRLNLVISLVRVVPYQSYIQGGFELPAYDPAWDKQIEASANSYLESLKVRLAKERLQTRTSLLLGHPASEIIDLAQHTEGSLVVMSSHGRSGVGRWLFGSVADRVLRASRRPILIIGTESVRAMETQEQGAGVRQFA